jgi:hypothetical protein
MKSETNLQKLLKLLGDGEWHTSEELSKITWRFGHTIHEGRNKGYPIEKRKIGHNQFEYRLSPSYFKSLKVSYKSKSTNVVSS